MGTWGEKTIFIGVISLLITGRGPPCKIGCLSVTLSPIIMVQWKMGPLNERKLILEIHPFSTSMLGGRVLSLKFIFEVWI